MNSGRNQDVNLLPGLSDHQGGRSADIYSERDLTSLVGRDVTTS